MGKRHIIFGLYFTILLASCFGKNLEKKILPIKIEFKLVKDKSTKKRLDLEKIVLIDNADIADAHLSKDAFGNFQIILIMNKLGKLKLKKLTQNNINKQVAILLDDKVISSPIIRAPITGGKVSIQIVKTEKEALNIISGILKYKKQKK